ncbi:putative gustatory receptor 59b [Drosophila bipectinata]|uniref:putative gustatory receptor 59b n=1 Tax=Drosophila bipectinata TaxID=42026 RepID=UPI001C8AA520|nr:putative gustatory receptor 59b [Drosophila bipectinata]
MDWKDVFLFVFLWNANNILYILPMGYFLVLWFISRGYDYVNHLVDQHIRAPVVDLEELQRLWSFHSVLSKAVLRVNRIYGPQMLAIRFDTFIFGVIQAYWGIFFSFGAKVPKAWLVYGSFSYIFRLVDGFLVDYMSELLVKYQKSTKNSWSETNWRRETSDFVIYSNSSKLELWTCGLYKNNRSLWLQMTFSVFNYFLVLLQFHLVLGKSSL